MKKLKLTIKANERITKTKTIKNFDKTIHSIEITFKTSDIWSDLEFWLNEENGDFLDHMALIISKRQKMQTHK